MKNFSIYLRARTVIWRVSEIIIIITIVIIIVHDIFMFFTLIAMGKNLKKIKVNFENKAGLSNRKWCQILLTKCLFLWSHYSICLNFEKARVQHFTPLTLHVVPRWPTSIFSQQIQYITNGKGYKNFKIQRSPKGKCKDLSSNSFN